MKNAYSFLVFAGMAVVLSTCNPHPNNATRRFSYAFRTRYNVYHHAKQEYDKGLKALSTEVYSPDSVLQLFDGCIQKCEKAIRLYSIREKPPKKRGWQQHAKQRKRQEQTEYNPFLVHCWVLMGKGYYYNREYEKAIRVFSYVRHHFREKPEQCTEALLWECSCLLALCESYRASYLLDGVEFTGLTKTHQKKYLTLRHTLQNQSFTAYRPDPFLKQKDTIKDLYESLLPVSSFFFPSVEDSLYHRLYTAYQEKEKEIVWETEHRFGNDFPVSAWRPAVLYLAALTYAADKDKEGCRTKLQQLITLFPTSSLTGIAIRFIENLDKNNELTGDFPSLGVTYAYLSPMETYSFSYPVDTSDYKLILLITDKDFTDQEIMYCISSFNFTYLLRKQLDVEIRYWGARRGVVISGFNSCRELDMYLQLIDLYSLFSGFETKPQILPVSEYNYQRLRTERNLNDYRKFYMSKEICNFPEKHK